MSEAVTADLATPRYTDSRQIRQGRTVKVGTLVLTGGIQLDGGRGMVLEVLGTQTNKTKTRDHHPRNRQEGCQITSLFYENVVSTVNTHGNQ